MPNVFSNFGYGMQGADTARKVQQDSDLEAQRITQAGQQSQLGAMGLEDAQRARTVQAATRGAATTAIGAGKTISGSLLDMSDAAAKLGDIATAQQYRDAHKQLESMGAKELVHSALTDPRPGVRPDLVQIMNKYEKTKDAVGAELDATGTLTITRAAAPPSKMNVGKLAELMGLVAPPKIHNIPAGGVGVVTQPGRDTQVISTPKTYPEHPKEGYIVRTEKDADGREVQRIIDVRPSSPTYGKEVGPEAAGMAGAGDTNIRKDLPVLKEITEGVATLGKEYGEMDMTNPLQPKTILTEKGQRVALVAEQIRLANQNLAPRTVVDMAIKGKPMWKTEDGKRSGVVLYNGAEFPMSTPAAKAGARPAAAPVAPAVPAAAAPPVAAPAPATAPPVVPPIVPPPAPASAPVANQRQFDAALEAKSPELKRLGNLLRLKPGNGQMDVNTWIQYANLAKKLGGKGYARGGKVAMMQHHGLG